jgi:demethylmenaquinone methyltransferase / 2-methoxy-6-polyprenyl-1,4-benzoquinol methylase
MSAATTAPAPAGGSVVPATPEKDSARIRAMFGRVARRYDLLNHLLSASLDRVWRRRLARSLAVPAGSRVLDLCAGTGDQAEALRAPGIEIVAADFCLPMLALARPKFARGGSPAPGPVQADALSLPFSDRRFDAASVSFGLRNVADLDAALQELARVLRPGGELGVLEFAIPVRQPLRGLYLFYFRRLLPAVGRMVSKDASAYSYLPSSVLAFPQREGFAGRMADAGFTDCRFESLSGGILCLYRGRTSA